ncbi:MAG: hypothetical protein U9R37_03675 [Campylobacterota bacterium]|nr:hypothetical protein [Campylobacterota bacterium]
MMKYKITTLRDNITKNIDYISKEYQTVYDILDDLDRIMSFDLSYCNMFQWWVENEDSINTINEILERKE